MIGRLKAWMQGATAPAEVSGGAELRVLMVCTGNICRSPTAEAVLRDRLARAGLGGRVRVDSAGTQGYHTGEAPDPRAVKAAAARGYDLRGLRARPLVAADFTQFDLLLAMDEDHLAWMQRKAPPGAPARIELLMPHSRRFAAERNVPDPYYGAPAGFDRVLDLVEDACDGLMPQIVRRLQDHAPGAVRGGERLKNST